MSRYGWKPYVPVAQRRAKAQKQMEQLRKKGKEICPVDNCGRKIACSFWGKGWCDHLESFSDYANRLPRGRTYVRNGSVCHLEIKPGKIEAIVSGTSLYNVSISIEKLKSAQWKAVKGKCSGGIGSMLELLQGRLSDQVMAIVTDRDKGLFPRPGEIKFNCSCPDWAVMCKHVAAVLYGVGNRLDDNPQLLFTLRGVDAEELISAELSLPGETTGGGKVIAEDQLEDIFGIDLEAGQPKTHRITKPQASGKKSAKISSKKKKGASTASSTQKRKSAGGEKTKKAATAKKSRPGKKTTASKLERISTGKSISRLRKKLGLSVADFAREVGVTPTTVYRWESSIGKLKLQAKPYAAIIILHERVEKKQ